jgi:hypothetical protein
MDRFTVVALPYSRDPAEKFHVSLFISPQLEAPGGEAPLKDSATFVEWTNGLFEAEIVLSNQSGVIAAQPLLDDLKPDAWGQVFPPDTPVRSRQQPDWGNRHWRTFRAAEVHDTAKLLSAVAMAFNPVSPGVPDRELDPLVGLVNSRLDLPSDLSGYSEVQFTASQDETIGEPREHGGDATPLSAIEKRIGATRGIERAFLELHRARRFYERPESQTAVRPRPIEGATRDPLPRPDPDFHERVSLLADHPGVLRKLGLVIDLRVDDLDLLAKSEWLSAKISTGSTVSLTSRTACAVFGASMVTVPRTEEWAAGRLVVGDAKLFGVLDMDADGAALKTDRFLWTIPRLLHTVDNKGEATTATPAMRTGGFTVVRHNRALETQGRIATQGSMGQNVLGGGAPLLNTEDVTQGYRVEVLDETVGKWATLHARRVDAEVLDHGTVFDDVLDEGFVQTTTASETPGVDQSPVHVHEAMFSWGGWSLSAPRPGKRVRHEAGEEIVEDPDVDPDPITPIVLHSRVEPGTLPRLRYGRSYAFRVWGVDLAGNSRPHDMVPPSPPQPFINQVAAVVDGLAGRGAPVGLETDLRDLTTVSVIRRRNLPDTRVVRELTDSAPLTGNTAVDASVFTRLQERRAAPKTRMGRSEIMAAIDRASLVERAFEELILDGDSPFLIEPVKFDPAVIAGGIDVVPELDPKSALAVTELRPFLRWEPVQPPTVVARHSNSAGESLLQLVIRSGVIQDPETLEIEVIPPDQYAAEHAGHNYRAKSERHLVPPKTSQYESELHGAFDAAIGSLNAADHKKLLAIAVREAGTLFDVDMPRLDDPNTRDPQPGIALVSDPGVPPSTLKTLPLTPGEAPAPGQYIVHDVDQVRVPYLPDPAAHGISLVFQDAGRDRQLLFPFGTEGFTARYGGTWPERNAFRVLLETAAELQGRLTGHALHIGLPPGDVQRFRLSSSLRHEDLDLFGFWRSLPEVIRNNADVAEAAADGWLWILTPFDKVTLVHAVPRPLEAPSPTTVRAFRVAGSTDSSLIGGVDVHGPSTEQLTAEARWTEYTDDLSLPGPESAPLNGIGFTTNIRPEEDLAVLAAAVPADIRFEIPGFGPVWLHRAVHQWGDTKHRQVTYQFRASTRYREYFDPETLAPAADASPLDDGQSVVGPEVTLSVPSSARPTAPIVHSVLPLLRWDVGTEPEQPMAVRSQRQAGVRIYLERPWYSSGEGELLAVLVAPGGFDTGAENYVSQWGADPIWRSSEVPRRGMFLEFDNLIRTLGIDTRPGDARPVAPPVTMPYDAVKGSPQVTVLGYQPQYNQERELWYVDVAIDPGDKFWPFVRLAVARYQPESINGCHLSAPVKCDFVQLLPERIASVSRTDVRHVRVVVSGSVGTRGGGEESFPPPALIADEAVRRNRRLVARLQRVDPNVPTDLGWDTIDTVDLRLRGAGRTNTEAAWVGELASPVNIPLRKPGTSTKWRVAIEEWELLKGDPADLGEPGPAVTERRLIYADELAL